VEKGYLSEPRQALDQAIAWGRRKPVIVVARDSSRLLRSEAHKVDRHAEPTAEEMAALQKRAADAGAEVLFATVEPPDLAEAERHRRAVVGGKPGRPRGLSDEQLADIFAEAGAFYCDRYDRWRWETPLADLAEMFHVRKQRIADAADWESPSGRTWRREAMEKAVEVGLMDRYRTGEPIMKDWGDPPLPAPRRRRARANYSSEYTRDHKPDMRFRCNRPEVVVRQREADREQRLAEYRAACRVWDED
jgi:hypothetical protein